MSEATPWRSDGESTPDLEDGETCRGTNRQGRRCRKPPVPGATVCNVHGGKAPQVAKAAAKRISKKHAEAMVAVYGLPIETTAEDALFDELHRSKGHVVWLQDRVQALLPAALVWGEVETVMVEREATEWPGVEEALQARLGRHPDALMIHQGP